MHRSGTSALAGSVQLLGVEFGSPLMPTTSGNEKGFFEHLEVLDLHRRFLGDLGRTWHDLQRVVPAALPAAARRDFARDAKELLERNFASVPLWGVKDPRLCRLLPLWLPVLEEAGRAPRCAIIYRHPREVADSLASRDGFSAEKSIMLWADHNLSAEEASRQLPRVFLDYAALLDDPVASLTRLGEGLELSWPVAPAAAAGDLAEFLSPKLRRHRAEAGAGEFALGRVSEVARSLYSALREADGGDGAEQRERLDEARRSYDEVYDALDPLLLEHASQSSPTLAEITEMRRTLADRTRWLRSQAAEIELQRQRLAEHESRVGEVQDRQEVLQRELRERVGDVGVEIAASVEKLGKRLDASHRELLETVARQEESLAQLREALSGEQARWAELSASLSERATAERELRETVSRQGEALGWQVESLALLRDALATEREERLETIARLPEEREAEGQALREVVSWQGESLAQLRRELEATRAAGEQLAAERERWGASAEMIWESKPWRLWLWVSRLRRRAAGRLRSLLSRTAAGPRKRSALIVDHRLPTPDQDSGSLRLWNLMSVLEGLGFEVTFVPDDLVFSADYVRRLSDRGIRVLTGKEIASLARHLEADGAIYDLVILCRAAVAANRIEEVRALCPRAMVVFDTVDLEFLRMQRRAAVEEEQELAIEARERKARELAMARAADATWVVSSYERDLLNREAPELRVDVVSNIHLDHGRRGDLESRHDILFIGGFMHWPNVDAAKWLVGEILPRVQAELEGVRLFLVGSQPPPDVVGLASDRVTVTGYVPDVEPYFRRCRLSVAPLRFGAGVKGKVNQSMAYGVPCVLTTTAAEGMNLRHREDAMIADGVEEFSRAVVEVYRDPDLWLRLSDGGLENVRRHFSAEVASRAIRDSLRAIEARREGSRGPVSDGPTASARPL